MMRGTTFGHASKIGGFMSLDLIKLFATISPFR
jgi:hypothetical protein